MTPAISATAAAIAMPSTKKPVEGADVVPVGATNGFVPTVTFSFEAERPVILNRLKPRLDLDRCGEDWRRH